MGLDIDRCIMYCAWLELIFEGPEVLDKLNFVLMLSFFCSSIL